MSDEDQFYIKAAVLKTYNFTVDSFFIWSHLVHIYLIHKAVYKYSVCSIATWCECVVVYERILDEKLTKIKIVDPEKLHIFL